MSQTTETDIAEAIAAGEPGAEVLLVEVIGGRTIRVFLDHPDGVGLDLCERVTGLLDSYRERYSVEVSSPGPERPLTKPEHFKRFSGRSAKLKLTDTIPGNDRQTVRGEIVEADDRKVVLLSDGQRLEVAYGAIGQANLLAA